MANTIQVGKAVSRGPGVEAVDAKATGSTLLGEVDYGVKSIATRVCVCGAEIDTVTSYPTVSVGTNSPDYDNIYPATSMTTLTETGKVRQYFCEDALYLQPGDEIYIKVSVAAVATTFNLNAGVEIAEH